MLTTFFFPLFFAAAGVGVWALRLESRITVHEQTDAVVHVNLKESLDELKATVNGLDAKVDRLLISALR